LGSRPRGKKLSERFAREAKVIASLHHPHICTLFDVGPNYLVMEMIGGPTLSERIKEGALSLEQTATIMRQVADALARLRSREGRGASRSEPGNFKIRPDAHRQYHRN
jgi:serine/threonine protein kinase